MNPKFSKLIDLIQTEAKLFRKIAIEASAKGEDSSTATHCAEVMESWADRIKPALEIQDEASKVAKIGSWASDLTNINMFMDVSFSWSEADRIRENVQNEIYALALEISDNILA